MNTGTWGKDPTEYLLDGMYKSVKMGSENIVSVLAKVQDRFMISELTANLEAYSGYAKNLEAMMHERGIEPEPPGFLSKIGARAGMALNTVTDARPSRIAEIYMARTGNTVRRLEQMRDEVMGRCDAKVLSLCGEIIDKERLNSAKMEAFL
ncbi:MAG: hypothetical protein IJF69_04395 [Clostridia bacterium]|nr:hypothetical protein [Clostridia bacterium]